MMTGGWGGGMGGHGMGRGGLLHGALDQDDESLGAAYDHKVVSRLARYALPYRKHLLVALICTLAYSVSFSATPRLIGIAIDHFITLKDLPGLTVITAIIVGNGLLSWITQYGQNLTLAYVGQSVLNVLRTRIFDHLQKLSVGFYDVNEVGKLMSRAQNDVLSLQELLTGGFFNMLQDVISLVIVVYILFSMNAKLALITFTVVPILIAFMAFWQKYARSAFLQVRQAIAVVNAGLQENISGVRVIQSLSREDMNIREFDRMNDAHRSANIQAGRLSAVVQPLVEGLVAVATALVVVFGGRQVLGGELAIGELVAFTLYVQRFFEPIRELTMQYTQFQRAMVGGDRIFEVLDTQSEVQDAPSATLLPAIKGDVRFEDVSFSYIRGIPILERFDLHVPPGETLAIVGATGAGKSTIFSLILRFYDVTSGRITMDGYDLRDVTQESLRRQIGIVLQDPFLFTGTVRENIRYGRLDATDAEVEAAAKTVGAHDFIMRLDDGYGTVLQERGGNFSVGQRQLLSFARAILADPKILMLDEATANVDTQTEILIQRALKKLLEGRTSFVIAHRLSTVRDAGRIIVLDHGRIVEEGAHAELLAQGGIYAGLYTMSYATVSASHNGSGVLLEQAPLTADAAGG